MAEVTDLVGKTITEASLGELDHPLTLTFEDGDTLVIQPGIGWKLDIQLKKSYFSNLD
jgi:hypothetical protein